MAEKEKKAKTAPETSETEEKEAETVPEKTELEKKEEELAAERDKYLRLAAEYDNFRKRTTREKEALFGDATAATVSAFLAVYDNMERAIATPSTDESYKKGVELIFSELNSTLEKLKVEVIAPEGEAFDPNFHSAVMHEDNEDLGENTVSEVFQKGFKLGERVIRPAIVKVAN
ncbi:MAG: nucleotide exchange factor GrpE [Oscillospiraceae bacterium]|nr:nucleotide exchange factor GrpE [Oscillospiraceae bacterium]